MAIVAAVAVAAVGYWYFYRSPDRDESSTPPPSIALTTLVKKDVYVGQWVSVANFRERMSIRAEGETFIVGDEGQEKYVGTMANGVLRVAVPGGAIDIVYIPSTDHLKATHFELRNVESSSRRTMADIRSIATAWEARAVDMNTYAINEAGPSGVTFDILSRALSPTYIRAMPPTDGWGRPYQFAVQQNGSAYSIRSFGENGRADETNPGVTVSPEADIVYSNGAFVSSPASHPSENRSLLVAASETAFRRVEAADEAGLSKSRTMADIRSIATAWEARAVDMRTYAINEAGPSGLTPDVVRQALTPTYIREMPSSDAWGNPLQFSVRQGGMEYSIRSYGENARQDETPPGATVSREADIVYSNGAFVSWPSGMPTSP